MNKVCVKCNLNKPIAEFNKCASNKDGLYSYCKECKTNYAKKYYTNNKETIKTTAIEWRKNNPKKYKRYTDYQRNWYYNKLKTDPAFRATKNARTRTNQFLSGKFKYSKSLGCSHAEFKAYIEAQFKEGMTWNNYGDWHIDHKYPLSLAYKEGSEAFANACHYTNLQPLWAKENLSKSNSIE